MKEGFEILKNMIIPKPDHMTSVEFDKIIKQIVKRLEMLDFTVKGTKRYDWNE